MMQHKQGTARDQINFSSFEDRISRDNPVRFIAIFSGKLDLEKIGFSATNMNLSKLKIKLNRSNLVNQQK